MPASMFDAGSYGSATAYCRAVAGISCMSPIAPLGDRARSLYADSTWITARTSLAGTFCSADTRSMISPKGTAGTVASSRGGDVFSFGLGIRHLVGREPHHD